MEKTNNNNKLENEMQDSNTGQQEVFVNVFLRLPKDLHTLVKVASALEMNPDGSSKKLTDVIIERLKIGLIHKPVDNLNVPS